MLDVKWIRDNQEAFVKGLTHRGFPNPKGTLNRILKADEERRETIQVLELEQATANTAAKAIGQAKQAKDEVEAQRLINEVAGLKGSIQEHEAARRSLESDLYDLLVAIPNMPAADVPIGEDERDNVELRKVGMPPEFDSEPKQHFDIGEALGMMDFETAAKLSGARFVVLKGPLARLERALAQFMLDLHTSEHGYTEINPPLLVRDQVMFGTGQLPKFRDDQFQTHLFSSDSLASDMKASMDEYIASKKKAAKAEAKDFAELHHQDALEAYKTGGVEQLAKFLNEEAKKSAEKLLSDATAVAKARANELVKETARWLIPTAEVPLTNLVREEIIEEAELPMRVTAGTPCFRAEAGAAGKDTRGMIRQHQFDKVELVSVTTPEQSENEHARMTQCAEAVLQKLGLPYRVVVLCTGDMGFAAQKTYDIEVWLPGQGMYREISSCSNCGDFQARRMEARYRPKDGAFQADAFQSSAFQAKKPRYVHTLNGSGVAVGRALIAVIENYQEADGSVRIPEALQSYMGGLTKIEATK